MPSGRLKQVYSKWPERHGFSIGGRGPSYVLYVGKGSAADKQGLRRGDCIIELDNHNVSQLAASALEEFANSLTNRMPTIKVVNDVQHVEILASRLYRCGLSLRYSQRNGFTIDSITPHGPAFNAGLKQGDLVVEVDGEPINEKANSLGLVKKALSSRRGRVTLAVLPCGRKSSSSTSRLLRRPHQQPKTSKELYAKMNSLFAENYEKKMAVVAVLKLYAESKNIEKLAKSLVIVLQTPNQRRIIPYIRLHIPVKDRKVFDDIVQRSIGKSYSEDRMSRPADHTHLDYRQTQSTVDGFSRLNIHVEGTANGSSSSLSYLRRLTVYKRDGDLGVILKGRHPVVIETVLNSSAADNAGLMKGDCILKINHQSVFNASHYDIQERLKLSGPTVQLDVIQQAHLTDQSNDLQLANGSNRSLIQPITSPRLISSAPAYNFSNYDTSVSSEGCGYASSHYAKVQCSRCGGDNPNHQLPLPDARVDMTSYDSSTIDSNRSHTSSADWAFHHSLKTHEKGPTSFKAQVNYLLDKREKRLFKQYLYDYNSNNDIQEFVQNVGALLDTPAKMTLWSFVLPLLSSSHKAYTLEKVSLPPSITDNLPNGESTSANRPNIDVVVSGSTDLSSIISPRSDHTETMTSFKSQLEYLLTSQERKVVKQALAHYRADKNIENLVESLSRILDTSSKRSLWIHILSLLPTSHQNYVRKKVNLPSGYSRDGGDGSSAPPTDPYADVSPRSRRNRILPQSEDEFFVVGQQEATPVTSNSVEMLSYATRGSYDQQASKGRRSKDFRHIPGADHFMQNPLYGKHDPLSLSREAEYPQRGVIPDPGISAYDAITFPEDKSGSYKRGRPNTAFVVSHESVDMVDSSLHHTNGYATPLSSRYTAQNGHRHLNGGGGPVHRNGDSYVADDASFNSTGSSSGSSLVHIEPDTDRSYNRKVSLALQSMDDAVAGFSGGETQRSDLTNTEGELLVPPPPPPPPPPPIPAPPPLPDLSAPLLVKRLNWETHNPEEIDKTVWGQWKTGDQLDIEVMVEYLELPQQFSTVKKKPQIAKPEKILQRKILRDKKAFNMSIILASLNIPDVTTSKERDEYIERALLQVEMHLDEEEGGVITPHLLKQLVQYAPDNDEVAQYMAYNDDIGSLNEVDRFCHRMVRIPGYLDRLKSMLFKATFDEKCAEVEKNLLVVKGASEEIRQSEMFAKILELVLAMGNQLNKATNKPVASAFKVSSLNQLDSTKTMDKKKSFLDVLVQAVHEKFPHLLQTSRELTQVPRAEHVPYQDIGREVTELQHVLLQITETMGQLSAEAKHYTSEDRFEEVMEHFVGTAEDRIQHLKRLQTDTNEQLESMLTYLGEKSNTAESKTIFSTISNFLAKFDNSHKLYIRKIEADLLSPRSPSSDAAQFIGGLSAT